MNRTLLLIPVLALVACTGNAAREDLDVDDQRNDTSEAIIAVMPDGFPNVAHKCVEVGSLMIGMWTTTDRMVILVYNDHSCEGSNSEQPQTVINASPRALAASGG